MILKNATIHTGDGNILEGCDLRMENGVIAQIGPGLSGEGQVIDLTGKQVFPGFIDAGSYMGTFDMAFPAKDYNENSSPVTPYLDIWHSIDPDEISRQELYRSGITSMVVTPGNEGVIGGVCTVVKTYGRSLNHMTIKRNVALKASVTPQVSKVFGSKGGPLTRMAMIHLLQSELARTAYGEDYRSRKTRQVMDAVRAGSMPLVIAAETAAEMESVTQALSGYGLKLAFAMASQAAQAAEAIKKAGATVILGECTRSSSVLLHEMDFGRLVDLAREGVPLCISLLAPDMVYGRECFLWTAAKLMQGGGDSEQVLAMMGANAAVFHGVENRIGTLKPGLDADVLIWDGNPVTQVGARLLETMICGVTVHSAQGWEGGACCC